MAPPVAVPSALIETVEYGHSQVRCPRCHRWAARLLIAEVEGVADQALLLCERCTTKAKAGGPLPVAPGAESAAAHSERMVH